jgi:hypothetical protein
VPMQAVRRPGPTKEAIYGVNLRALPEMTETA